MVLFIFIPLFLLRYFQSQPTFSVGDRIRITTRLAFEPRIQETQQVMRVYGVTVYLPRFPEFHYGDRVVVTGTVKQGTYTLYLESPEIMVIAPRGILPRMRAHIIAIFERTLPQSESSLLAGVTLGAKETIRQDFLESLKRSGVLHVVVASGMNVTLVSRFLIAVLVVWLTRRVALVAALTGIWVYVLLIGADAPIVRAAVMGSLAFLAQETGRISRAWWSLFLAGSGMLIMSPQWISDVGFLLSFSATGGILAFEPWIKKNLTKIASFVPNFVKQDLSTSLAAQICTTPILFVAFGQFAPWSIVANTALLWTIAPMTMLGFVGGFVGLLIEPLGKVFILLSYPLVWFFVRVVELF
ncbi:ComEC/Rec2 family competence protein [Candidatus Microgenomates bacterium]|nr:ComEC/Rec2 family competence protein [Candidatus Microgenomates bacterium]